MTLSLPDYYFRIKENGALVFRVDTENRQRRIELEQIAAVNVKNGEVKPHGGRELSEADRAAIDDWLARRRAFLTAREHELVERTLEQLNLTTQWANSRATPEELEEASARLLLAMHDLRTALVRKQAASG